MYQHLTTLQGARDAVISVAFSVQAKFIAAVGYGGISVWNLDTSETISVPNLPYNPRDPDLVYTACSWLHFDQGDRHYLLLGSQSGNFTTLVWDRENNNFKLVEKLAAGQPDCQVLSIDVYQPEITYGKLARIVVATADQRVAVYSLSTAGNLVQIFSRAFENFQLVAAKFCRKTRDAYAFELSGGGIVRLDEQTGDIKSQQRFGPDPMGTVCVDESSTRFVVCTGQDFEMYRLDTLEYCKTFRCDRPIVRYPKVATFAEDEAVLVGGTDNGRALVFDVSTGNRMQDLSYPNGGLVQPVAACTTKEGFLVAIAGSASETPSDLLLYRKKRKPSSSGSQGSVTTNLYTMIRRASLKHYLLSLVPLLIMMNGLYHLAISCVPVVQSAVESIATSKAADVTNFEAAYDIFDVISRGQGTPRSRDAVVSFAMEAASVSSQFSASPEHRMEGRVRGEIPGQKDIIESVAEERVRDAIPAQKDVMESMMEGTGKGKIPAREDNAESIMAPVINPTVRANTGRMEGRARGVPALIDDATESPSDMGVTAELMYQCLM